MERDDACRFCRLSTAASGKATSDRPDRHKEKDIPRPKPKRPVDAAVAAAEVGRFTPSRRKSTGAPKPTHELPIPRGPPPRAAFTVPEFCEAHRIRKRSTTRRRRRDGAQSKWKSAAAASLPSKSAERWKRERRPLESMPPQDLALVSAAPGQFGSFGRTIKPKG